MKKVKTHHKIALITTILLVILLGVFVLPSFDIVGNHWNGYEEVPYKIEGRTYKLLVADTEEKYTKGLMGIDEKNLNGFNGMIFLFDDMQTRTFWNKNTHLDITIYWIADNTIVGKTQLPAIDKGGKKTVSSPRPVDAVVEIVEN